MTSLKFLYLLLSIAFVKGWLYRLPNDVVPIYYELRIAPGPAIDIFRGEVNIKVHVKFTTNRIILHSRDLKIGTVELKKLERNTQNITATFELDENKQIIIIKSNANFEYNTDYNVWITFKGSLNGYWNYEIFHDGFYKQYGWGDDLNLAASTHFEATGARSAFPCFDEPRFRAIFNISLARPENYTALSNMPSEAVLPPDSLSNGFVWEKFQPTPPMPTYLVAFVLAQLKSLTSADGRLRCMARPELISQSEYALKQAEKLLKYFEGYTGIPYSLPKLDLVPVPNFKHGAMENWGLIIYENRYFLLKDPNSAEQKNSITTTTSHELAHLWFGDLVTIPWYDYVWLKEGFASYFQYFGPAAIEPSWDMESYFVVKILQETLIKDIEIGKPMTRQVRDFEEIFPTYDEVSDGKAACVLRMFEMMFSSKTFRNALHNYLKNGQQKQHGVALPRDLFDAFDHQVELDSVSYLPPHTTASDIMKTWTDNVGYPVINVIRNYDRNEAEVTQVPFKQISSTDQKWIVPLTYTTKSEQQFSNLLPTHWSFADEPTIIPKIDKYDWLLFNLKQSGYYRVNYDKKNWNLLITQLNSDYSVIHPLNRAQLIDDATVLFIEGKVEFSVLMSLLEYLKSERDIRPLYSAIYAAKMLVSYEWNFKEYLRTLFKTPYESVACNSSSSDEHVVQLLKSEIRDLGWFLDLECLGEKVENRVSPLMQQPGSSYINYISSLSRKGTLKSTLRHSGNLTRAQIGLA